LEQVDDLIKYQRLIIVRIKKCNGDSKENQIDSEPNISSFLNKEIHAKVTNNKRSYISINSGFPYNDDESDDAKKTAKTKET